MSDHNDEEKAKARSEPNIDEGLSALFGVLSAAIGDALVKIDEKGGRTILRDQTFDIARGPIRAHAGLNLRTGGQDISSTPKAAQSFKTTAPIGPLQPRQAPPQSRPLEFEVISETDLSVITADMPGVSASDLTISRDKQTIIIKTNGVRRYHAEIPIGHKFELTSVTAHLRNGILTLDIPKED